MTLQHPDLARPFDASADFHLGLLTCSLEVVSLLLLGQVVPTGASGEFAVHVSLWGGARG